MSIPSTPDAFEAQLGYRFRNPGLLRLALTHPSTVHEHGSEMQHNQRLEFLGDAVLQLTLTRALYEQHPDFDEGALTKARAQLVNQQTLADEALRLDIGPRLILSRGEEVNGGRERPSIMADAFEAVLGAIYLDSDFEVARQWLLQRFAARIAGLEASSGIINPKGELQELLQADSTESPQYRTESATGPDHDRAFVCSVHHLGKELGRGSGKSKKAAESQAAAAALENLRQQAQNSTGAGGQTGAR